MPPAAVPSPPPKPSTSTSQACLDNAECGAITYLPPTRRCLLKGVRAEWERADATGAYSVVVTNCPSPPPPPRCAACSVLRGAVGGQSGGGGC